MRYSTAQTRVFATARVTDGYGGTGADIGLALDDLGHLHEVTPSGCYHCPAEGIHGKEFGSPEAAYSAAMLSDRFTYLRPDWRIDASERGQR